MSPFWKGIITGGFLGFILTCLVIVIIGAIVIEKDPFKDMFD